MELNQTKEGSNLNTSGWNPSPPCFFGAFPRAAGGEDAQRPGVAVGDVAAQLGGLGTDPAEIRGGRALGREGGSGRRKVVVFWGELRRRVVVRTIHRCFGQVF